MSLKMRRLFPIVAVKDRVDPFLYFAELPIGGEHHELVMWADGPCIAVNFSPNSVRAKHEIYAVPYDMPFQAPLGRKLELLETIAFPGPRAPVYTAFYKLGPWPTSPLTNGLQADA